MRMLAVLLLLAATTLARAQVPVDAAHWSNGYDHYFQKYSKRYFGPFWDWRWFKAQAIVESTLKSDARNPSGAVGLMQVLPSTFNEIRQSDRTLRNVRSPRWNIAAGIYYDHYLYLKPAWETLQRRLRLLASFAAYNAGYRRAAKACRIAAKPVKSWLQLAPHLPLETRNYVNRIIVLKTGGRLRGQPRDRGIAGRILADSGSNQTQKNAPE